MNCPENLQHTKDHQWALIDGDIATIGMNDHAQSQLGDITFVELPKAGDAITQNQSLGIIESVKTVSELYEPLSGTVTEVDQQLIDNPELINQNPYLKGSIVKIKLENKAGISSLLAADAYQQLIS